MKFSFITIIAVAFALVIGGTFGAHRELDLAFASSGSDGAFFSRTVEAPLPAPVAISSSNTILRRCANVVGGLYGRLQPPGLSQIARERCRDFAQSVLARMPTHGLAAFGVAQMQLALGETASGSEALRLSQGLTPHEQWLAEARVELAETHYASLSPDALEGHTADLALLARSNRGVRAIAYRYVSDPAFRERITSVVETLPGDVQTRFVSNVRRAAEAFGIVEAAP